MKNVLVIFILVLLVLLCTPTALARDTQTSEAQSRDGQSLALQQSNVMIPLGDLQYDMSERNSLSVASEMSRDKGASAYESATTESIPTSMFPYFFYVFVIIGLLAVLSFDTSGTARAKRKQNLN